MRSLTSRRARPGPHLVGRRTCALPFSPQKLSEWRPKSTATKISVSRCRVLERRTPPSAMCRCERYIIVDAPIKPTIVGLCYKFACSPRQPPSHSITVTRVSVIYRDRSPVSVAVHAEAVAAVMSSDRTITITNSIGVVNNMALSPSGSQV